MNTKVTRPVVFFDFESTGPDRENDRIIQYSFKRFEDSVLLTELTGFVDPGIPIPAEATEVHGITNDDVQGQGPIEDHIEEILAIMYGAILSGYNILNFDLPLLESEMRRINYPSDLMTLLSQESEVQVIDVMRMYQELRPRTLEAAYREYVDPDFVQTHRADDDVRMTAEILNEFLLTDMFKESSLEELNELSFGDRVDWSGRFRIKNGVVVVGFGKHRDKPLRVAYKKDRDWFEWAETKIKGFKESFRLACLRQRSIEEALQGGDIPDDPRAKQ